MTEWKGTAEVAIIGGGIMGASTAYHLAQRGCTDIVILEKALLAQAAVLPPGQHPALAGSGPRL